MEIKLKKKPFDYERKISLKGRFGCVAPLGLGIGHQWLCVFPPLPPTTVQDHYGQQHDKQRQKNGTQYTADNCSGGKAWTRVDFVFVTVMFV